MNKPHKIAIHSVPRSGSSWLGQIVNSSRQVNFKFQPLFSYAFKDYLDASSSAQQIAAFFDKIALSNDAFLCQQENIDKGLYPQFYKDKQWTHTIYKEVRYHHILHNMLKTDNQVKLIALIRNPLAVVNSFLRAPREFRKDLGWREQEEWRFASKKNLEKAEEFNGYEKWKQAFFIFQDLHQLYPNRVLIIYYDKLLKNPILQTQKLFDFCMLDYEKQTEEFLLQSTQNNKDAQYAVYKIKQNDDDWMQQLDGDIITAIIDNLQKYDCLKHYLPKL
ncbi:MAG: sulfotransferase [Alphaproteobacteria bacterium]|nr:sulfotransferase [Alphaproteobacteria bacterium]